MEFFEVWNIQALITVDNIIFQNSLHDLSQNLTALQYFPVTLYFHLIRNAGSHMLFSFSSVFWVNSFGRVWFCPCFTYSTITNVLVESTWSALFCIYTGCIKVFGFLWDQTGGGLTVLAGLLSHSVISQPPFEHSLLQYLGKQQYYICGFQGQNVMYPFNACL